MGRWCRRNFSITWGDTEGIKNSEVRNQNSEEDPHPGPLPEYREREKQSRVLKHTLQVFLEHLGDEHFEVFTRGDGADDSLFVDQEHRGDANDAVGFGQRMPLTLGGGGGVEKLWPGHVGVFTHEALEGNLAAVG